MLLEGRNAVVYGGGGGIGAAMARGFARHGARVFLAGRTRARLAVVADEIRAIGGSADIAEVDALDEAAVDRHADAVVAAAGTLDISVNVISIGDVQGTPLAEMTLADFEAPVHNLVRTTFLTTRAAARHMMRQRRGVILIFGGYGDPLPGYHLGGLQVAFGAVESLRANLASELGPAGIRVVTLQTAGVPETIPADFDGAEAITRSIVERTMLGRAAGLEDVGDVAAFAASDLARSITGSAINMTCGAVVG
jgi:3-oxoacyl-[acyl-carrier protein] reductase